MSHAPRPAVSQEDRARRLRAALAGASHALPAQGPIGVFIHHNTLHAFQHLPFHDAVAAASATFGAEGYLSEARYLELYRQGRITDEDLRAALTEHVPEVPSLEQSSRALLHPVEEETESSLRWKLEECAATSRLQEDVSPGARRRLMERSLTDLHGWMERVGRDWTMTELATALLGPELETAVRGMAGDAHRALPMDIALRLLGIPAAHADTYVEQVSTRLAETHGLTVEGWLSAEAAYVTSELAAAFGGNGSLGSLREQLEQVPEPFAVSALWSACRMPWLTVDTATEEAARKVGVRSHREWLRVATGEDVNDRVHPQLIRACAAFLDEGVSHWHMPDREQGFHAAWVSMKRGGLGAEPDWLGGLRAELARGPSSPEAVVLDVLDELEVPEADWEPYLVRVLLALPGWAGMMHRLEHHPSDRAPDAPPARLMDFLAVRLTLERHALREVVRRRFDDEALLDLADLARRASLASPARERPKAEGSWRLFRWAQLAGLSALEVQRLPVGERQALLAWQEGFDASTRRRVWQEAYEHHYRTEVSRGLARNRLRPESVRTPTAPRFQVMFCMDDREESMRRHFEELDSRHETFGIAGFFGVAFDYQGLDDAGHVAQCPVVVTPAHIVEERAQPEHGHLAEARARLRAGWARFDHGLHQGAHALEVAWLLVPLLGLLSALLLPLHVLFPRALSRLRRGLASALLPMPRTRLTSLREQETSAHPALLSKPRGFTVDEKAARVAATLESLGLVEGFAPWVVLLGHGAVSVNNPHQAAYDCGACGGRHGGPNARLFAEMANRPEVRKRLRERGIHIPDTTWFIGGLHNTTTDEVRLYDTETVPGSLRDELSILRAALDRARALSAQERCRRFESAPLGLSPAAALRHVEARAADLGQPRPELGHVTNAACIVGRRALTRGLFLDRRAFLISYDPTRDASGAIVERILLAAGPVGAGISLEYYFSCVDNERYGCGTKLPHNPTGLLGVMDGAESDLRTGLPRQMIEIHEPMRLLLIVEASTAVLTGILERQPALRELIGHEWVQLVSVDPLTGEQQRLTPRGFQHLAASETPLPEVAASPHWYRGHRDFLPPALIHAPWGWPVPVEPTPSGERRHVTS